MTRSSLLLIVTLVSAAASPARAEQIAYIGRLGLYNSPEFSRADNFQLSDTLGLTEQGYSHGVTTRYSGMPEAGQAAWVADAAGAVHRAGFYGSGYTLASGDLQSSWITGGIPGSYLVGQSVRYGALGGVEGAQEAGQAAWMVNAATGVTTRLGLFTGPETTRASGNQFSNARKWTASGFIAGDSALSFPPAFATSQGVWAANTTTGESKRLGLTAEAEFVRADGHQASYLTGVFSGLTANGLVAGHSTRFADSTAEDGNGRADWIADATTGTTTRVGLFSGPEFTSTGGRQQTAAYYLSAAGRLTGISYRYNGDADAGRAAWIADGAAGTTTRVGFHSGNEFTRSSDGYQFSTVSENESLNPVLTTGYSQRFNGSSDAGRAVWVVDPATNATKRFGFHSGSEFTRTGGYQESRVDSLTPNGLVAGVSFRYSGTADAGQAAWIGSLATGSSVRVGLFAGSEFTRSGSAGYQFTTPSNLTNSGYLIGASNRYRNSSEVGIGAWVASLATGITTRIGLFSGSEFTRSSNQYQSTIPEYLGESGLIVGQSVRFSGNNEAGRAAWLGNAATGTTTRIGLFNGAEYTRSSGNYQNSYYNGFVTENGMLAGYADRYNGNAFSGLAAWSVNTQTAATTRIGITDAVHTGSASYQNSTIHLLSDAGYIAGSSDRFNGNAQDGQTAWIYKTATGTRTDFAISVRASDGYAFSSITGVTGGGLAYGYYERFEGSNSLGNRAFIWSQALGVVTLDSAIPGGIGQYGWQSFDSADFATGDGLIVGTGTTLSGGTGVFAVRLGSGDSPLVAWKRLHFADPASPEAADLADYDKDGIPNLVEYAFHLSPKSAGFPMLVPAAGTSGLPFITSAGEGGARHLRLEFIRLKAARNPGVLYEPQFSNRMEASGAHGWQTATGTAVVTSIDADWERVVIEDTTPAGSASRFGRVKVSAAAP